MANMNIITGAVMLETMWDSRNSDLLDLITPFVNYSVSKYYSVNDVIETNVVADYMKREFGYTELPESIIVRVFSRNKKIYLKKNRSYYLIGKLDNIAEEFDKRKNDAELELKVVGESISNYLNTNCKNKINYSIEDSIDALSKFFSEYGIYVGTNRLLSNAPERNNEQNYFVAKYIIDQKNNDSLEYKYILNLIKGYFLETAIYLQKNSDTILEDYSKVTFVYDTPFLIDLLGYQKESDKINANELHNMLKKKGAKFAYFENIKHELESVLYAYKNCIGKDIDSHNTLEGLDEKNTNPNDVDRIIAIWPSQLSLNYGVDLIDTPDFDQKNGLIVNLESKENEIKEFIKTKTNDIYRESTLNIDIKTLFYINRLRGKIENNELEKCKYILVTTNGALSEYFNSYYRENVNKDNYQLVINDFQLSSLVWVKSYQGSNLSETQLLKNAYAAISPAPELLEKFTRVFNKMNSEGKFTEEEAMILRTRRYVKKEFERNSIVNENQINEQTIENIISSIEKKGEMKAKEKYENNLQEKNEKMLNDIYNSATEYSNIKSKKLYNVLRLVFSALGLALVIYIIILSLPMDFQKDNIGSYILLLFLILSTFDTLFSKRFLVDKLLQKVKDDYRNKFFNDKYDELRKAIGLEK